VELDGAAYLSPVCLWAQPHRQNAGVHLERSGHLGTAAAPRIESRNCGSAVRVNDTTSATNLGCLSPYISVMNGFDSQSFIPLKTHWFHIMLCLAGGEQHGYRIMQEVLDRAKRTGALVAGNALWIDQAPDRSGTDRGNRPAPSPGNGRRATTLLPAHAAWQPSARRGMRAPFRSSIRRARQSRCRRADGSGRRLRAFWQFCDHVFAELHHEELVRTIRPKQRMVTE